jgi:hypothetical protein
MSGPALFAFASDDTRATAPYYPFRYWQWLAYIGGRSSNFLILSERC